MTDREIMFWAIGMYGANEHNVSSVLRALNVHIDNDKFSACLVDVTDALSKLTPKEATPNHD